ncbi:MAG: tRNA (adenosine(37)-N6)-threonylcarbamoyltransferase complex ATPase subunit type 1 TsaE [Paludibacter sp. 47-17]|nr:MAG: tRNA (adenosine(37)-N6)-threonylcarbamoyltransferase complex ATPase subunit type 1 TsaE [Paludibacter sp. 47-17]
MKEISIDTIEQLPRVAQWIIDNINSYKIIIVDGEMGAGKTTLIKEIGKLFRVEQIVNSPTFAIINEYETRDGKILYHFDCYRIESIQEALEIGIPEYLESGNLCFIEWAENIRTLLPEQVMKIKIFVEGITQRRFSIG